MKGVVTTKLFRPYEVNWFKNLTGGNKGQASKSNKYRGNKTWTKSQVPYPKAGTDFKGWCSDLEGYIFNLVLRSSEKFFRTMKDLERYLGATYSNGCKLAIMTKTPATFPDPEMTANIPDT